ncbi:MAG: amino acid permease [Gemmataceae bacterium]|nr:amino acid permease [Gemmataceae bacterium]MCI0739915.1 amino acid permease [Gemmataceae bacterium]
MSFSAPARSAPAPSEGQLGLWDTVSIIVGIVVGTTIFYSPWLIFGAVPNPWMAMAVWLFGGFLAFIGGLCYAELATTYPRSGGDYAYLSQAFGPGTGFLFGWAQMFVIMPASIGAMAFVFASMAHSLMPLNQFIDFGLTSEFMYAILAVGVLTLVNIVGVTVGKVTQNILSVAKVVGLVAICVAGFVWGGGQPTDWTFPETSADWGWGSLAIILVLYAFGGWNDAAFVAAEVRDRRRNIPLALLLGIGAITVIYMLVNLAYIHALGFEKVQRPPHPDSLPGLVVTQAFQNVGGTLITVIIMASALGAMNGLIFTGSRIYASLGQDHKLFGFLGHWQPGSSPIVALLLQGLVTVGWIYLIGTEKGYDIIRQSISTVQELVNGVLHKFWDDYSLNLQMVTDWTPGDAFGALVSHSAPAFWLFFLLAGFSLFRLRDKYPGKERPFSVPLYPLVPIIFCCMCAYMLYRSTIYIEERVIFVIVLLLLGLPFYGLSRLIGGHPKEYTEWR